MDDITLKSGAIISFYLYCANFSTLENHSGNLFWIGLWKAYRSLRDLLWMRYSRPTRIISIWMVMNKIITTTALYMKLSENDSCKISRIYISINFKRIAVHDTWFKKKMQYVFILHGKLLIYFKRNMNCPLQYIFFILYFSVWSSLL